MEHYFGGGIDGLIRSMQAVIDVPLHTSLREVREIELE